MDINEKKDVFQLLKSLEEAAYTYMALGNPNDELWLDNKANKQSVLELKLFRNIQSKSLLLICHQKLSPKEFSKVLKMLSVISFRYNVISSANPKLMEVTYNKAAIKVNNGILISARDVFDEIKQAIYLSDEQFVDNFKSKTFNTNNSSNKKIVRYILFKIENQISSRQYEFEGNSGTIEHILPESYNEEWNFSLEEHNQLIYRLGNLTILEPKKNNREAADKSYKIKEAVYKDSSYELTKAIPERYENWNSTSIKKRQAKLALISKGIWKI